MPRGLIFARSILGWRVGGWSYRTYFSDGKNSPSWRFVNHVVKTRITTTSSAIKIKFVIRSPGTIAVKSSNHLRMTERAEIWDLIKSSTPKPCSAPTYGVIMLKYRGLSVNYCVQEALMRHFRVGKSDDVALTSRRKRALFKTHTWTSRESGAVAKSFKNFSCRCIFAKREKN